MSKKDALLVCIREQARYSQAESLFYLSVLRGVQPYAADEKMLTPLFFLCLNFKNSNRTFGSWVHKRLVVMADSKQIKTKAVSQVSTANNIEKAIQEKFGLSQQSNVVYNGSEETTEILPNDNDVPNEYVEVAPTERVVLPKQRSLTDIEEKIDRLMQRKKAIPNN